jgi:hypothetical protein
MQKTLTAFVFTLSLSLTANPTLFDSIWTSLSALWDGTEAGGGCDPNGLYQSNHPQPHQWRKEGGGWDPDGLVLPDPEEGGGWDPNGRGSGS